MVYVKHYMPGAVLDVGALSNAYNLLLILKILCTLVSFSRELKILTHNVNNGSYSFFPFKTLLHLVLEVTFFLYPSLPKTLNETSGWAGGEGTQAKGREVEVGAWSLFILDGALSRSSPTLCASHLFLTCWFPSRLRPLRPFQPHVPNPQSQR